MSGWSAATAVTPFPPSYLAPQPEHCFETQSTSQVSASAVSSHSFACQMCPAERQGFRGSRAGRGREERSKLQRLGTQVLMWEDMQSEIVLA